jgi:hypothetical protein
MDAGHSVREQIHYIHEAAPPGAHEKEVSFLRHLMLYGDTNDCVELEKKIAHAERNERCARRAVWLMMALTGLSLVGLGYDALLLEDFPPNTSQFLTRIFCALGLASLVSLLAFAAFWLISRGELDEHRERCRRLVTKIVEARLGKPSHVSAAEIGQPESARRRVAA